MVITERFKRTICIFCLTFFISISYCQINFYKKAKAISPGDVAFLTDASIGLLAEAVCPPLFVATMVAGGLYTLYAADKLIDKYQVKSRIQQQALTWSVDVIKKINDMSASKPTSINTTDLPTGLVSNIARTFQKDNTITNSTTVPADLPGMVTNQSLVTAYNSQALTKWTSAFPSYYQIVFKYTNVTSKFMDFVGYFQSGTTYPSYISTCTATVKNTYTGASVSGTFNTAMVSMGTYVKTAYKLNNGDFYMRFSDLNSSQWTNYLDFVNSLKTTFGVNMTGVDFPVTSGESVCYYPPIIKDTTQSVSMPKTLPVPSTVPYDGTPYVPTGSISLPSNPSIPADSVSVPITDSVPSVPSTGTGTDTGTYIPVLSDILNVLKDIWDWLKDILQKIYDAIMSIPTLISSIPNLIVDGIEKLFVPTLSLDDVIQTLKNKYPLPVFVAPSLAKKPLSIDTEFHYPGGLVWHPVIVLDQPWYSVLRTIMLSLMYLLAAFFLGKHVSNIFGGDSE